MGTPHKWAEVIKAWADGETVQRKFNNHWLSFTAGIQGAPSFDVYYEWRVKPKPYRVALFVSSWGDLFSLLVRKGDNMELLTKNGSNFIRYLTDWFEE